MKINRDNQVQSLDSNNFKPNVLKGKKVLATGTLNHFSRKDIEETVIKLGGTYASSVSTSLDFVIAGENAGSKLNKARELGVLVIEERQFVTMITGQENQTFETTTGGKIDVSILGYGEIVDFKLLHENDYKNLIRAIKEKDEFSPNYFPLNMEEDIYDILYDTEYEISSNYDNGYFMSIFAHGYHELTINDSDDENNRILIEGDADSNNVNDAMIDTLESTKAYINEKVLNHKYTHILVILMTGQISDFEESIPVKYVPNFIELDSDEIEISGQRKLIINGFQVKLSGDNWDLIDGDELQVFAMSIEDFMNFEKDPNKDYIEFKIV